MHSTKTGTKSVTCVTRDEDGDIIEIGGSWGTDTKKKARSNITTNPDAYRVGLSQVQVVVDDNVKDGSTGNNLDNLKDCSK